MPPRAQIALVILVMLAAAAFGLAQRQGGAAAGRAPAPPALHLRGRLSLSPARLSPIASAGARQGLPTAILTPGAAS